MITVSSVAWIAAECPAPAKRSTALAWERACALSLTTCRARTGQSFSLESGSSTPIWLMGATSIFVSEGTRIPHSCAIQVASRPDRLNVESVRIVKESAQRRGLIF